MSTLAPGAAAAWAEGRFLTPPRLEADDFAPHLLASASCVRFRSPPREVAAWSWGEGPPVLLLHGWGGRASQLAGFVAPLSDAGYRVLAVDLPAHGASPGRRTTLVEIANLVAALADSEGPLHGILAHSMGAVAAAYALSLGLAAERAVFLGSLADFAASSRRLTRHIGLSQAAAERLQERLERRLGVAWSRFHVAENAARFAGRLLVVHDRADKQVPWSDGAAIAGAAANARLLTTMGLGHTRVLRDPEVIAEAVGFLAGSAGGAPRPPAPSDHSMASSSAAKRATSSSLL